MSQDEVLDPDSLLEPDLPGDFNGEASDDADPEAFREDGEDEGSPVEDERSYSIDQIISSKKPDTEATVTATKNPRAKPSADIPEEAPQALIKAVPDAPSKPIQSPTSPREESKPVKGARLKTLFEQVLEGQPPERAKKFHELKNVMGLREDDALWGVIAIMDIHLKLFEDIPKSISDASISATEAAKAQAIQEIQAALARESEKMSQAVSEGLEARSASLFIEHLTWYGAIVLLYSAFVFSVGYAAGGNIVPPWMRDGIPAGLMRAPLGPVAGSTLVASSIFLVLRALTIEPGGAKFGKMKRVLKLLGGLAVAGLGIFLI